MGWFGGNDTSLQQTTYQTDNTSLGADNGGVAARNSSVTINSVDPQVVGKALDSAQINFAQEGKNFASVVGLTQNVLDLHKALASREQDSIDALVKGAQDNVNDATRAAYQSMMQATSSNANVASTEISKYVIMGAVLIGAIMMFKR